MISKTSRRRERTALAAVIGAVALLIGPVATAGADPVSTGTAGAFGATITAGGETVVPPTPEQTAQVGEDNSETVVDIPADPVAVSGTLTADASVHEASDLPTTLVTEGTTHTVEGDYNARGVGVVEELDVLLDSVDEGVSLLTADLVRAEAVGVCSNGTIEYSANSEIINLQIGGQDIPVNAPVQDLVDAIGDVLEESGLNAVVDVQRNVVTVDGDGASVDALVVTVLAAAGEDPLAQVRIAHAEVGGLTCGAAAGGTDLPECSDGIDNDGDTFIDHPNDPGCDSPQDDSELDDAGPATSPEQTSNVGLPRTGGETTVALAVGITLAGLAFAGRRFWATA